MNNKEIAKCRRDYVTKIIQKYGGEKLIKYIGKADPNDIEPEQMKRYKELHKGTELIIEYHSFEMIKSKIPMILQWRVVVA